MEVLQLGRISEGVGWEETSERNVGVVSMDRGHGILTGHQSGLVDPGIYSGKK